MIIVRITVYGHVIEVQVNRGEMPNLDRLLDWTTLFFEKERYL
jgi:hypothetical protein